ncbi:MAG: Dam family site-specific DNA-(adenine-N6)-methyltransferase [Clostridiales bacterium]|nr:Dam family site-specific DNA-(adenine-N6)-methyltransferase [Clostridiales bacterium]
MPQIKKIKSKKARPFIKWAGGKCRILSEIQKKYPPGLGEYYTKYAEPFVGGGAVFFDIVNNFQLKEIYISDLNRELIYTYKVIRDRVDDLINLLNELENEYLTANSDTRKQIFYSNRNHFNLLISKLSQYPANDPKLAALFIFLNHTCYNGLYRVNSKGKFNVPQGIYKKPVICNEFNLRMVSEKLNNVSIICGDFKLSADFIDENTFVYFDPPYRPLSKTSSFTDYALDSFTDKEQRELALFIDKMSERGAWILASNSDPKNVDTHDDFFDSLYSKHEINRIQSSRAINSKASSRGRIDELLIKAKGVYG